MSVWIAFKPVQILLCMWCVLMMQSAYNGVVLLKGKAGQHSVEFSITLDSTQSSSPVDAALPVHRLAAKAQIKQLEDGEKGMLCCILSFSFG